MKNQAFTLIELLVVVLIIGILAAIAVPQYRISVEKTRATQILPLMKSIAEAEKVYFLANGNYTNNLNDLDISTNNPYNISIVASSTDYTVYAATKQVQIQFVPKKISCWAKNTEMSRRICSSLGEERGFCNYCSKLGGVRCCEYIIDQYI